jgi:hypothetical protein
MARGPQQESGLSYPGFFLGQLFNTKNMMKISKTLEKLVEFTLKLI